MILQVPLLAARFAGGRFKSSNGCFGRSHMSVLISRRLDGSQFGLTHRAIGQYTEIGIPRIYETRINAQAMR